MKNQNTASTDKTHYLKKELVNMIKTKPNVLSFIQIAALDGVWYWDLENPENEWVDDNFWKELGYDPSEMSHSPSAWQEIIHPEDLKFSILNFEKHCENPNHPYDQMVRYTHKNGSTVYIRRRGIAIRNNEGKPIRMLGAHNNVTSYMEASNKLEIANENLRLKNKELEHFSYIASHDLQEPINTIQMFVDLIKDDYNNKIDEECNRYLNYISDSVDRMRILITSLLDYSRLGIHGELSDVDCNKILKDVIEDITAKMKISKAELNIEKLPIIRGYEMEIRLLFQNLIGNAIKFRKENVTPIINVKAEKKNGWTFQVSDNGIGIPEKEQTKIFGIFHRLHNSKDYGGTGIGLAHCNKVVSMHNGEIWVESTLGKGSTFYFNLNL